MKEEDFQTDRATPNILHVDTGTTNNNQSLNLEHTRYKWQPLTSEPGRHARYASFLGEGPQHIIVRGVEGRRQSYELNFRETSIKNQRFKNTTSLSIACGLIYCCHQSCFGL